MLVVNDLIVSNFPAQTSSASCVMWIPKVLRASYQVSVSSGSLNGTFTAQVSNDQAIGAPANVFLPTNWATLGSVTVVCSNTTQGSGVFLIQYFETSYEYMKLVYTAGNASAALGLYNVRMVSKGM